MEMIIECDLAGFKLAVQEFLNLLETETDFCKLGDALDLLGLRYLTMKGSDIDAHTAGKYYQNAAFKYVALIDGWPQGLI